MYRRNRRASPPPFRHGLFVESTWAQSARPSRSKGLVCESPKDVFSGLPLLRIQAIGRQSLRIEFYPFIVLLVPPEVVDVDGIVIHISDDTIQPNRRPVLDIDNGTHRERYFFVRLPFCRGLLLHLQRRAEPRQQPPLLRH